MWAPAAISKVRLDSSSTACVTNSRKDIPGSLDEVKRFGFKYAELDGTYKLPPAQYTEMLAARGIKGIGHAFSLRAAPR